MSARCLALLFVGLIGGVPRANVAAADGIVVVPNVDTLRGRVQAARGALLSRERLTQSYTHGGLTGTIVTVRDGKDFRVDDSYGPLQSARGAFRGQAWHQNQNGETVLEQPEAGKATHEATATTVSRVSTPLDAFVIATLNAAGDGTKQYIDPTSYRVVRFETIRPTGTIVTSYDDFHTTGGFTRAWHWMVRDGYAQDDADYHVVSDDVGGAAANLAVPGSRRAFVEFPAGKTSIDLPVREDRGKFIVRVQVGSRGLDLVLDTGAAAGIALDDDVVRSLGLAHYGSFTNAAAADRYIATKAVVPEMSVGELRMHDVVVSTIPHVGDEGADYKAVGLLGFDFIAALALKCDYEKGRVTATQPEAFVAPTGPEAFAIPVRLGNQSPLADVTINGALGERFLIDTGGGGTMLVFDYFARRHPEALNGALSIDAQPRFRGVGGAFETRPYRVAAVKLGNIAFRDFRVYRVTSAKSYSGNIDGAIGSTLLQLFTLYTDYGNSMLYLVPNAAGHAARS